MKRLVILTIASALACGAAAAQDTKTKQGIIVQGGKTQRDQTERGIIVQGGKTQRGIIVQGGKTDRGIIVQGGTNKKKKKKEF